VRLAAGDWEAELAPEVGGAIFALRWRGRDVLRPTHAGTTAPLETASFALVPYANRIAHGAFTFEGLDYRLPLNFGDHPHVLHGLAWQQPWSVAASDGASARLTLEHAADAVWPWSFAADQVIALDDGLSVTLTLTNRDDRPMPAGLGMHPYFPRAADTRLTANFDGAWLADATMLPTERVAPDRFGDWAAGDRVDRAELVDHVHDGWDGLARIESGGMTVRLTAEGTRWAHLYMPPGEPYFCFEPVSHLPDAVNARDPADAGVRVLQPGEGMTIRMRIEVE
jgi:aldose 1-epimerase